MREAALRAFGRPLRKRSLLVFVLALAVVDYWLVAASTKPSLKDIPAADRTRAKLLAQVERGAEIAGVRPYKLGAKWVYVLQNEPDFTGRGGARARWNFRADPRGHPPHYHPDEVQTLPATAYVWARKWTEEEAAAAPPAGGPRRELKLAETSTAPAQKLLALTGEGVVWAAHNSAKMLATLTETKFTFKEESQYVDWLDGICSDMPGEAGRMCRADYAGYVRDYGHRLGGEYVVPSSHRARGFTVTTDASAQGTGSRRGSDPGLISPDDWSEHYLEQLRAAGSEHQDVNKEGRAAVRRAMKELPAERLACPRDFATMTEAQITTFFTSALHFMRGRADRPSSYTKQHEQCAATGMDAEGVEELGPIPRDVGAHWERSASWAVLVTELAVSKWAARAGTTSQHHIASTHKCFLKLGEVGARATGLAASRKFYEDMLCTASESGDIALTVTPATMEELSEKLFRPYASTLRMEWGLSDAKYQRFGKLFKSIAGTLSAEAQAVVHLFTGSSGSTLQPFESLHLAKGRQERAIPGLTEAIYPSVDCGGVTY